MDILPSRALRTLDAIAESRSLALVQRRALRLESLFALVRDTLSALKPSARSLTLCGLHVELCDGCSVHDQLMKCVDECLRRRGARPACAECLSNFVRSQGLLGTGAPLNGTFPGRFSTRPSFRGLTTTPVELRPFAPRLQKVPQDTGNIPHTAASFQAKLCASATPVLSPRPPVGGNRCAASPTRKTLSLR